MYINFECLYSSIASSLYKPTILLLHFLCTKIVTKLIKNYIN